MAPERPEGGAEKHHGGKERALEDASYLVWEGEPLTSPKIPQILTPAVSDVRRQRGYGCKTPRMVLHCPEPANKRLTPAVVALLWATGGITMGKCLESSSKRTRFENLRIWSTLARGLGRQQKAIGTKNPTTQHVASTPLPHLLPCHD